MEKGFIRLSRKFFTHQFWTESRTYSVCEAWLFLIKEARFDAAPRTESIGGREITWKRGQYPASIRFLAREWGWTERAVRSFLNRLKKNKMITTRCTQGMNVITLCNYELYNPLGKPISEESETVDTTYEPLYETLIHQEICGISNKLTQLTDPSLTQQRHSVDTRLKKEKERKEKRERVCNKKSIRVSSGKMKEIAPVKIPVSSLKETLLSDAKWVEHCRQVVDIPEAEFAILLPARLDQFIGWIQAIDEEDSIATLRDAKRRFVYWMLSHVKRK